MCVLILSAFAAFGQAPPNDNACQAVVLTPDATCTYVEGTNLNATNSSGVAIPAASCGTYSGGDVWFRAIVPAGGALTFDMQGGTMTDGCMAVYSGTNCIALTFQGCDDNSSANPNMPKVTITGQVPGRSLFVRVWSKNNASNGTFGICATIPVPPPANDEPCTATELTVGATCSYETFTTESATSSNVDPPVCAGFLGGDVWFKVIVPPATTALVFDTQRGVVLDGGMNVYRGSSCTGTLTELACDDNSSANTDMPKMTIGGLTPGDTVWVRFWENGNNNNGTFGICVTLPPPPPANDEPCNAVLLTAGETCTFASFTNENATGTTTVADPGCANYSGGDVWFKVVVPAGGAIALDSDDTGTMTDGGMALYRGTTCDNLTIIDCDDNSSVNGQMPALTVGGLTPGDTVWVRFWENNGDNNGTFSICAKVPPPAPVNDDPCGAIEILVVPTCTFQQFTNETSTGTPTVADPSCTIYNGGDVWFRVIVPAEGALVFNTQAGGITDAGMAVYKGNCNNLEEIDCNDDDGDGNMAKLTLGGLTPNDTLWVRVWEYGGDAFGTFGICITPPPPPPANDNPCTATELIVNATCTYQEFTTADALGTTGVADPGCGDYEGSDVWFRVIVPAGGAIQLDTDEGIVTDAAMAVYTGTCGNLALLGCDDDASSNGNMPKLIFTALNPGDTLWVRVWEAFNDNNGTFSICATIPPPPPANDEPCAANELIVNPTCAFDTFSNESATGTTGVPAPGCAGYSGGDVWFKVIVPAGGAIQLDTQQGQMSDGGMAVYRGNCNSLTLLTCDDNSGAGNMPKITLTAQNPGDTLWVRVWENGNNANGTFGICATIPPPPPSNDNPCNAAPLTAEASCTFQQFTNENATNTLGVPAPGCGNYQGGDVWFSVVVPSGGALTFNSEAGVNDDAGMAIYRGTCSNLTLLDCEESDFFGDPMPTITAGGLTPGDTIWVRFWEWGGDNNGTFGICVTIPPPGPVNDDPCGAIEITPAATCNYQIFSNENSYGTVGVPAPGCASFQGSDVWFKIPVPPGGAVTIDTDDGGITDGGMAIYTGSCDNLSLVECDDDDSDNGNMPKITVGGLAVNDTVWVRIWEFGGNTTGTFGICATIPPPPPANDNPCGAVSLLADTVCNYQSFTTVSAYGTASVPNPVCGNYQGADVWFTVIAPAAGALNINTEAGTMDDAAMAIYSADSCNGAMALIACDDNGSSNRDMAYITATGLTPGSTIYIRVWPTGGSLNSGTFGICAVVPPLQPATFSFSCSRDTSFNCGGGDSCFTLDAIIPDIHALTDRYAINPLSSTGCFNPYIDPGTDGPSTDLRTDDVYTDVITLPFTFPFYGANYNALIASTNGYVSFDVSEAGNFSHWDMVDASGARNLPSINDYYDRALIMGPYHDLNPFLNTSPDRRIKYNVTGTAPHRRWILSFYKVPLFDCDDLIQNTHQIVLYEGTGVIEVFIFDMQSCPTWNEGRAMVGIQNWNRDQGMMAPGRAATNAPWQRIGLNESWRFVPIGGRSLFKRVELFDTSGNFLATGDTTFIDSASLKVNFRSLCALNRLPAGLNTLLVRAVYEKFDDPTQEEVGADTIRIFIPNLRANFETTNATCTAGGTVNINLQNGVLPIRFSSDSGITWQSDSVFANLAVGTYYFKVQDGAGCARDTIVDIILPDPIFASYLVNTPKCNGGNDGSVIVTVLSGGSGSYEYAVDGGAFQADDSLPAIGAGPHLIKIRDSNGCTKDTTILVGEPTAIAGNYVSNSVKCFADNSGSIIITASGGTAPYDYSIDNGTTYQLDDSFAVVAGVYVVRIRDANGCIKDSSITVTQPDQLLATASAGSTGCNTITPSGNVSVTVTGGTRPYSYSRDGINFQPDSTFTGLGQNSYSVTITDANGCTVAAAATVGVVNDLTLQTRQDTTICGEVSVVLNTITNAQSISWAPPTFLSSTTAVSPSAVNPTVTTEYVVTAQTGICTATDTVKVIVTAPPIVDAGDWRVLQITKGQDATLNGTISNATSFAWSPTTYLNNANTLTPTAVRPQETIVYTLTAFNAEGCSNTDTVTLTVVPYCIKVKNAFTPNGDGVNDNWMVYDQFDCLTNVKVQVFNRYGSKVFESKNYRNDWNGTYNGQTLPDATYYYVIDFLLSTGIVNQVRGDVTILR